MGMQGTGREGGAGVGGGWRQVGKGGRGENRRRRAGRGGRRGWGHAPRWAAPTLGCSAPTWPRLQAHPSPWPAGRRGLEELKKPDSESQRAPRHRPAPRFGGVVVQRRQTPESGASGGTRCPREPRTKSRHFAPLLPSTPLGFLRPSPPLPLLRGLEGPGVPGREEAAGGSLRGH